MRIQLFVARGEQSIAERLIDVKHEQSGQFRIPAAALRSHNKTTYYGTIYVKQATHAYAQQRATTQCCTACRKL